MLFIYSVKGFISNVSGPGEREVESNRNIEMVPAHWGLKASPRRGFKAIFRSSHNLKVRTSAQVVQERALAK